MLGPRRRRALRDPATAADGGQIRLDDWLALHSPDINGLLALADDDPPARPQRPAAPRAPPRPAVPVPGDPAALLDELRGWLTSYVAFPSAHAAVAVTLWIVHTHLAACFDSTGGWCCCPPNGNAARPGYWSWRVDVRGRRAAHRRLSRPTCSAGSAATMPARSRCCWTSADAIWKRGKGDETAEALRSIIYAGHRKGATVGRVEMNSQTRSCSGSPCTPRPRSPRTAPLPDTIMSRAIVIHMRRRAPGEEVRRYRERVTRPEGEALAARSPRGPSRSRPRSATRGRNCRPGSTTGLPTCGSRWSRRGPGGRRLARARPRSLHRAGHGCARGRPEHRARLLADLRTVFGDAEALWTETILDRLHKISEAPWGDWYGHPLNPRDLAKLLGQYRTADGKPVRSCQVRKGDANRQGYIRRSLLGRVDPVPARPVPYKPYIPYAPGQPRRGCRGCRGYPGRGRHHTAVERRGPRPGRAPRGTGGPPGRGPGAAWPEGTIGAGANAPEDDDEIPF